MAPTTVISERTVLVTEHMCHEIQGVSFYVKTNIVLCACELGESIFTTAQVLNMWKLQAIDIKSVTVVVTAADDRQC